MGYGGIILELDDKGALLINNEGEYLRIRRTPDMVTGIYVEFSQNDILKDSKRKISAFPNIYSKYLYVFGGVAAVIVIMVSVFMLMSRDMTNSTFAYIDIDINPSIDLKINSEGYVVGVEPLNEDAEKIVRSVDYRGQKAENAVLETVKKSAELGYFRNVNKLVLVAAAVNVNDKTSDDEYRDMNNRLGNLIESIENRVNAESKDIQLIAFNTSPDKMKQARENHMSIGRYSLYKNAGKDGIELALEDAKVLELSELIDLLPSKDYTGFKEEEMKSALEDTQFTKSAESSPNKNNYAEREESIDNKIPGKAGDNTQVPTSTKAGDLIPDKTVNSTPITKKDEIKDKDKEKEKTPEPLVTPAASPSTEPAVHQGHDKNKEKADDVQPTVYNTITVSPTPTQKSEPEKKPDATPSTQQKSSIKPVVTPPGQQKKNDGSDVVPPGQEKKNGGSDVVPPGQQKKNDGSDVVPPGQQKKQSDSVEVSPDSQTTQSDNTGNSKGKKKNAR